MLNLKTKITALTCSFLMVFGLVSGVIDNKPAEAVTYRSSISGIMSRPYPRIMANQFHSSRVGETGASRWAKLFDIVVINKENDLFVDNGATVDLANLYRKYNPNVKVLQYLNLIDVWEGCKTWYWMKNNGAFLYDDAGKVVHPYAKSYGTKRWAGNSMKTNWQDYYAARAGSIAAQGMDGIFSDNWFRSNAQAWNINSTRFSSVMKGWETMGQKVKSRMGSGKILLGNSPAYGLYQSRDLTMIEMRNAPNSTDFNNYLKWSDASNTYGQGNIDAIQTVWDNRDFMHSYSSILSFSLPACLLTDNIFGVTNDWNILGGIEKVGKVGYPKGPRYRANYVLQRDFSAGKVVFNDTSSTRTITLPSGYKRTDGTSVSSVTLSPYRGIILKTSGTTSGGTTTPTTVPGAPTNLVNNGVTKTSAGNYNVSLSWKDNSSIESGYKVYVSYNSTSLSNYKEKLSTGVNSTSCNVDLGTSPASGTYYFRVVAYNAKGNSSPSNAVSAKISTTGTTPTTGVPSAPTNLKMMGVMKGSSTGTYYVQLNWDDKSNISGFKVLQSINSTSSYSVKTTTSASQSSATINLGTSPTKGTYYYKVQAYNSSGTSASSNTVSASIQ